MAPKRPKRRGKASPPVEKRVSSENTEPEEPERTYTSPPRVSCVFCDRKFHTPDELRAHLNIHQKERIGAGGKRRHGDDDEDDGRTVSRAALLPDRLRQTGHKSLPTRVKCDECGEVFPSHAVAMSHKFRKHRHSKKRYNCSFCGRNFPLQLEIHVKTSHAGEDSSESLQCPACVDVFHNQEAMDYHMDTYHKRTGMVVQPVETPPPSRKIKVNNAGEVQHAIYCHLCGCEYMVKFNLRKHLLAFHDESERCAPPERLVKCDQCSAIFYSEKAYQAHVVHHSPGDLYVHTEGLLCSTKIDADFHASRVVPNKPDLFFQVNKERPQLMGQMSEKEKLSASKQTKLASWKEKDAGCDALEQEQPSVSSNMKKRQQKR